VLTESKIQEDFTLLTSSTALRCTETGAPLSARRIRILPTNEHACEHENSVEILPVDGRKAETFNA
jgi:hypothetical protein